MYSLIIISIFINIIMYSNAVYLGEKANYLKPKLERNNVLNKGLWMKDRIQKSNYGDFIFRADSGDVDNLWQNNFDALGDNNMDNIPVFSSYVERNKRSTIQKQRLRKSLRKCKDKMNCIKRDDDKKIIFKSKFISQLRPASVFNDYPYEVAVLLANSNKREIKDVKKSIKEVNDSKHMDNAVNKNVNVSKLYEQNETDPIDNRLHENVTIFYNTSINIPKRRMTQPEFDLEGKEKISDETFKNTKHIDGNKINRNVFDKEEVIWQSAPVHHMLLPRPESPVSNKPVSEKGLVKILSLLTKTFKKVMKQHNDIQEIDNKLHSLNEDFMKNVAVLDTKLQEFDNKYTHLIEINEGLQHLSKQFTKKSDELEHRETKMSKNLREFEEQQKNFLTQQHQFYTIQKFMLDQNEKINHKQSMIAKTQSEISHRQNHFERILKKAKQLYMDNKLPAGSKLLPMNKLKNSSLTKDDHNITTTTQPTPVSTETVKINLFSIPKIAPLLNYDKLILKEKNVQPVDDLVYKYYFNNTFIDNIMKSKVLTAVIDNEGKNTRNAKNKRNDLNKETTILLPVGGVNESPIVSQHLHRERRWIRHPSKIIRKPHGNEALNNEKILKSTKEIKIKVSNKDKNDPYFSMATSFCTEIGQNHNEQMLNWCVEKSLRRLKSIDMPPIKPIPSPPLANIPEKVQPPWKNEIKPETTKLYPLATTQAADLVHTSHLPIMATPESPKSILLHAMITEKSPDLFFPDNDELETKLKEYELKPDPEGTVYFDGSLHTSDIVISGSDALSDIMPGLDSNSHVDLDPLAIDLQARRRAYVRRLNENILKMNS